MQIYQLKKFCLLFIFLQFMLKRVQLSLVLNTRYKLSPVEKKMNLVLLIDFQSLLSSFTTMYCTISWIFKEKVQDASGKFWSEKGILNKLGKTKAIISLSNVLILAEEIRHCTRQHREPLISLNLKNDCVVLPYRPGGIPARNAKGERVLLFIGIIDILQSYRLKKKLEHTWKSILHDGVRSNWAFQVTTFEWLLWKSSCTNINRFIYQGVVLYEIYCLFKWK